MKKILLLLLFIPLFSICQEPEKLVHNNKLYVDDYAEVFTPAERLDLDAIIRSFFDTAQISVVTLKSFDGIDPGEYAVRLGRAWGVGGKSNNGLLIIIGVEDRKMFAATGPGLEGDLPDITVVQLQREYAIPKFKEKKYFEGTRDLLNAYINRLSPSAKALREKEDEVQGQLQKKDWGKLRDVMLTIFIILIACASIIFPLYTRKKKKTKEEENVQEIPEKEILYVAPVAAYAAAAVVEEDSNKKSSDDDDDDNYSYKSNNDSYSSPSSNDDNSGSSFGGGSFSGGGGGSNW